jgi:hypothetical protein
MTITIPTEKDNPQKAFADLREWVGSHCNAGHPVRNSALSMARSTIVHRLLKYGPDDTLNTCTARDLMGLLIFVNGALAEYLMRVAYIRSLIEGDHEVYEHLNTTLFIPDLRAWYWQIAEAMLGRHPDPQAVTVWVENMRGEEKSLARLIIARIFPDTTNLTWLDDVPENLPRLAAELIKTMATPERKAAIESYLRTHPRVRLELL